MVSVIVPVYNREKHIVRCVNSILRQTFEDIEVILVDDGSTDASLPLISKIAEDNPCVKVLSQKNSGVSMARNNGLRMAHGKYVSFVDADDYIGSYMLEKMVNGLEDAELSVCNFVHDDTDRLICPMKSEARILNHDMSIADTFLNGELGHEMVYSVCNKMYHRDIIEKFNIQFDPKIAIGEDMLFTLQYLLHCNTIHFINEGFYHYCLNTSSAINSANRNYLLDYNNTICALLGKYSSYVSKEATALWAFGALRLILNTPFVVCLNYRTWRKYYKDHLYKSELFNQAKKAKVSRNIKHLMLFLSLQSHCSTLLFMIVRSNVFFNRRDEVAND